VPTLVNPRLTCDDAERRGFLLSRGAAIR